ncbi:MAG: hypothetical protein FWG29_05600 [Treponema sp.]|nr:hypothetical protein [Treponema sp.]
MPEKKGPVSGKLIRGRDADKPIIADLTLDGNVPVSVVQMLENEIKDIDHGGVSLIITIRDGHLSYRIEKTISLMPRIQRGHDGYSE